MFNLVIFSRNPLRLHLLADSLRENNNNPKIFDKTYILYEGKMRGQKDGYFTLKRIYTDFSFFDINKNNKNTMISNIKDNDYTCFCTDEDVLYDKIENVDPILRGFVDPDVFCFSLRLGENIKFCHKMQVKNAFVPEIKEEDFLKWDWTKHYLDFGFPFSMNGNIYRTKEIMKLLKQINFEYYEQIEEKLAEMFEYYPKNKMCSFKNSKMINIPYKNLDKDISDYLNGHRIEFEKEIFGDVDRCCKDMEFENDKT